MTELNGEIVKAPELPELEFEENCHIYRLDGAEIPSVSRVMEPLSKANYSGISEKVLDRAASKGTSVHNSIEIYVKYGIIDVNPEHKSYFDGFLDWWEEVQPEVVGSEIRVYHKILQYAGTIDLLCYINGKLTLVDFKTTSSVSDMSCGIQLEAYAKALESHGIVVEDKMILHLKRDGKHRCIHYPANDAKRWKVFGALKTVYDYIKSYKH